MTTESIRAVALIIGAWSLFSLLTLAFALLGMEMEARTDAKREARRRQANADEAIAVARAWRHVSIERRREHVDWMARARRAR